MKHLLKFIVFFTCAADLVFAQKNIPIKYLNAEAFTVNNGLSQGLINGITQDHFGFMWFGTLDGLNRYDGYNVSVFRNEPGDPNSVSENYITAVFEDSKNRMWVGTKASGLNLFDYETEHFIHFKHNKNQSNSLSDDRILSIQEDACGALWVGTKNGLNKIVFTGKDNTGSQKNKDLNLLHHEQGLFKIKHIQFDISGRELFYFHEAINAQPSFFEPSFFVDLRGLIFVRTEKSFFCIQPTSNMTDTIVKLGELNVRSGDKKNFSAISSLANPSCNGQDFLFMTAKNFLTEINPNNGIITLRNQFGSPGIMQRSKSVPVIDNNLWFISNFNLYQYNEASQKVAEIKSHEASEQLFISSSTNLYKDHSGILWIGTGGYGALKFDSVNQKFNRVKSSSVHWLYSNALNKVLTREGDVFYLLQKSIGIPDGSGWGKNAHFFRKIYRLLHGKYISAIVQGTDSIIWVQAEGIQRYNLRKKSLKAVVAKPIGWYALYVDEDNELYFADDTLLCNVNDIIPDKESYPIPSKIKVADFYVETIFKDAQHIVWLGTTAGLFSFDEGRHKWCQYLLRTDDTTSLSSNLILSICENPDGKYLWIGTNGGGFNRFDKETGKCNRYTIRDGLPNNVVYGILADDKGNLWMSTNNGICNFNPVTKKFENYTSEDGLQGNEFNRHAYCKAKDGTMFFGGVNGYNYFNPKYISENQPSAPVVITDIKSNGHSIDFLEKGSALSRPAYLTKKIVFNFIHNTVSFDFSAMYFKASAHNKYYYMFEGVDKDWISTSTNHSAVYSNLQPGKYTFKVKIGYLNMKYATIEVVILTPWYMTWWFNMLLIIFIAALVYLLYSYHLKQQIRLYKDHQRIASDLHDEIGSTLSSIHIYSEVAQSRITSKPLETQTFLKEISSSVENTIGSLDDIVWMLKAKNDRFEDIENRMRAIAVNICEASGYNLQLHFDEQLKELKFGKETSKNLFLIYKEAINNVMKYAHGKNLSIDLSLNKNEITLAIRDDGKGFINKDGNDGNGLSNMQKRAKWLGGKLEIISATGKGTNIILTFNHVNSKQKK